MYKATLRQNEEKSAATLCYQVATKVKDMCHNFYIMKNHKTAINSTTMADGIKISTDLASLEYFF